MLDGRLWKPVNFRTGVIQDLRIRRPEPARLVW